MPCAPGPGGVAAEQMYMPGTPTVGLQRGTRAEHQLADVLGAGDDVAADVVGVVLGESRWWSAPRMPTIRSRKPGANRSIWAMIASVASPV